MSLLDFLGLYKRTSQDKIDTAVHDHALWLRTHGQQGKRLNMNGFDLSDINLSGADLRRARLRGANLTMTNLADALVDKADLRGAAIVGTEIGGTRLEDAKMSFFDTYIARETPNRPPPRFRMDGQLNRHHD